MTPDEPVSELDALVDRYASGIAWLSSHDPTGAFYVWFQSGILPHHPMPAQSEDRRADYKAWFEAFRLWLALDAKIERLERKIAAAAAGGS